MVAKAEWELANPRWAKERGWDEETLLLGHSSMHAGGKAWKMQATCTGRAIVLESKMQTVLRTQPL